jgi:hypothetical protein
MYDVFQVGDDVGDLDNLKIAIVPKKLEFVKDPETGRAKFGLQYSFAAGNPSLVSLTTSIRYHNDKNEIASMLAEVETKLGLAAGALKVSSLNIFSARISFFVREEDGTITQSPVNTAPGTLDGSYAVSLDLSQRSKAQLLNLFDGKEPIGGFIGIAESNAGIFERKNDASVLSSIVAWAKSLHVLSLRQLTFPDDATAKSNLDIRISIAKALGLPSIIRFGNSFVLGWDLDLPDNAAKLSKLISDEKRTVSLVKIADRYAQDSVLTLNIVCSSLKNQIVNIEDGDVGCEGLSP